MSLALIRIHAAAETVEGFTEPYRYVAVAAAEPGIVSSVEVIPGQSVVAGQILATLDAGILERTLAIARHRAEARGSLRAAEAEFELRRQQHDQLQQLRTRGHATEQEYARCQAELTIAQARLQAIQEELQLDQLECQRIEEQIERRKVRSPMDGVVVDVAKEVGEAYLIHDTHMITVAQLDRLRARFAATPHDAADVRPQQQVQVMFPDGGGIVTGTVEYVAPLIDAKSGTVQIEVVIPNRNQQLTSGSRCFLKASAARAKLSS